MSPYSITRHGPAERCFPWSAQCFPVLAARKQATGLLTWKLWLGLHWETGGVEPLAMPEKWPVPRTRSLIKIYSIFQSKWVLLLVLCHIPFHLH